MVRLQLPRPDPTATDAQAILARQRAETLSSVLYPDDRTYQGKELRLKQQHFFVSATLQARLTGPLPPAAARAELPEPAPSSGARAAPAGRCTCRLCQRNAARRCAPGNAPSAAGPQSAQQAVPGPQDVLRRYKDTHTDFSEFERKVVFQLNDTHPTLAVPELMRLLMDDQGMGWTRAWEICSRVRHALARRLSDCGACVQQPVTGTPVRQQSSLQTGWCSRTRSRPAQWAGRGLCRALPGA